MQERSAAAPMVLNTLRARDLPESDAGVLEALSTVKGMFTRIYLEDQWDWFTVMAQMGYPPRRIADAISKDLSSLRSAIRDRNETCFRTVQVNLHRLPARQCLRAFLGELVVKEELGAGWLYVLSTREYRDLLKIGMTTRTVEERVAEINRATGVAIPFGVRRCWRVTHPGQVERKAHACLSDYRLRGDREFFRIDFIDAAKKLDAMMAASDFEIRTLPNLVELTTLT